MQSRDNTCDKNRQCLSCRMPAESQRNENDDERGSLLYRRDQRQSDCRDHETGLLWDLELEALLSWWPWWGAAAAPVEEVVLESGWIDDAVKAGDISSLSSSLEPSVGSFEADECVRACLRILLRTLKLRPQPSKGHVKAIKHRQWICSSSHNNIYERFSPVWLLRCI